jgi:hypothetical protein
MYFVDYKYVLKEMAMRLLTWVALCTFSLIPSHSLADWALIDGERRLIATSGIGATAGFLCQDGLPLLVVKMQGNPTGIRPYADSEAIEFVKDASNSGSWTYVLSGFGLKQLFDGLNLTLEGIYLFRQDKTYAQLSLKGFTRAFTEAGLDCNPAKK